jgi:hypothetical protein
MVYVRIVIGGIAAPEWFHCGAALSFVAQPMEWDAERDLRFLRGIPWGLGSRQSEECSLDGELLGSRVHHQG